MKRILFIMLAIGTISCETDNMDPETVDLEKFTIQLPGTWNATKLHGYDSFAGQIEISDIEKISFDLGWYSNQLNVDPTTHDIAFMTIDDKRAKIVKPKNFGQGTTGVYFDSLETTKTNKFQMSGTGLSSHNQKLLLTAIESLKFKK
jgi:hypothetical protein